MKFQPDTADSVNLVTRHEVGRLWVGSTPFEHSLLLPWVGEVLAWGPTHFAELNASHFERIVSLKPEVVIFGSGRRLRFASAALMRALFEERIGVETMDTAAACRTYNVLASEGRSVVAALLLEDPSEGPG